MTNLVTNYNFLFIIVTILITNTCLFFKLISKLVTIVTNNFLSLKLVTNEAYSYSDSYMDVIPYENIFGLVMYVMVSP